MTIIERLERMSRLGGDNETEFVQVQTADLAALLECVKAQHAFIHASWAIASAVIEAEKKVGVKP